MSKSLRSMSESERKAAIARRLSSNTKGLGYWAAVDAQARLTKRVPDAGDSAASPALSPQSGESTPEVNPAATQRR